MPFSHLVLLEQELKSTRDEFDRYKEVAFRPFSSEDASPGILPDDLLLEYPHITEQTLETVKLGPHDILTLINQ
jgi:hypothetical protein